MAAAKKNVVARHRSGRWRPREYAGGLPKVVSYHPAILECYLDRSMDEKLARSLPASIRKAASKLRSDEVAALRILHCMRPATHRGKAA